MSLYEWLFNPFRPDTAWLLPALGAGPDRPSFHFRCHHRPGLFFHPPGPGGLCFPKDGPGAYEKWVIHLFVAFFFFARYSWPARTTHLMSILTLWSPAYGVRGGIIKAITAMLSIATAAILWPLIPKLVALAFGRPVETAERATGFQGGGAGENRPAAAGKRDPGPAGEFRIGRQGAGAHRRTDGRQCAIEPGAE